MSVEDPPTIEDSPSVGDGPSTDDTPAQWQPGPPRLGPALIVIAIAIVLIGGGALLALFGGGAGPSDGPSEEGTTAASIHAVRATPLLHAIATPGQPPADVLSALVVPEGSVAVSSENNDQGLSTYDRSVTLRVDDTASAIESFYRDELARNGWTSRSTSPVANNGLELFGRHISTDGFYWEIGVVVTPASPSLSPALSGDSATSTASVELRIFEVDDEE